MTRNDSEKPVLRYRPAVAAIGWGLLCGLVPLVGLALHAASGLQGPVIDCILAPAELFSFFVSGDNSHSLMDAYVEGLPFCLAVYVFAGWAVGFWLSARRKRSTAE